jgi:hypothetical protein
MGKPGVFKRINGQDQTITPFKVYKSWRYTSTVDLQNDGIDLLYALKPDPTVYSGNKVTLDTWQTSLDTGSYLINTANDKSAAVMWHSLNHLYYKRAGNPAETFGYSDPYTIERTLFNEAMVYSIPQRKFGEAIKPGTVKLNFKPALMTTSMSLVDDGKGNLIDTALSSSISGEVLHLGFDAMTYCANYGPNFNLGTSQRIGDLIDFQLDSINPNLTAKGNVWINNDTIAGNYYSASYSTVFPWGNDAFFTTGSYIRIPNDDSFNFKQTDDFALSFWLGKYSSFPAVQQIISKRTTGTGQYMRNNKVYTGDVNYNAGQYPFDIYFPSGSGIPTGLIYCKNSNGNVVTTISGTISVSTEKHVVLQKTGSTFQLYIGGTLVNQANLPTDGNFYNDADLFIGSLGLNASGNGYNSFKGTFDEFFIFNKGLTQSEITQLADSSSYAMTTNTNVVGNVFYEHGLIVISDPRPKYNSTSSFGLKYRPFDQFIYNKDIGTQDGAGALDNTKFKLEYNSTVTLYEHEYVCKLKEDEFNFTSNPTIRLNNDVNSEIPKDMVSSNSFAPYITTVGLYNDAGQLLAVGKLGTPIQKRDNVDANIIVRFDI